MEGDLKGVEWRGVGGEPMIKMSCAEQESSWCIGTSMPSAPGQQQRDGGNMNNKHVDLKRKC